VILSDLVNDLWDVQSVFQNISSFIKPQCRILLRHTAVYGNASDFVRKIGLAKPALYQNWLTVEDIAGFTFVGQL